MAAAGQQPSWKPRLSFLGKKETRPASVARLDESIGIISITAGAAVAGHEYFSVKLMKKGKRLVVTHPYAAFREVVRALRFEGQDEMIRSQLPRPGRSKSFANLLVTERDQKTRQADAAGRAEALEVWFREVVQVAQWGCLAARVVEVVEALVLVQQEEVASTDDEARSSEDVPMPSRRRRSGSLRPEDARTRIAELEAIVRALRERLAETKEDPKSLAELEAELKAAAGKLFAGDETVEAELDRLDAAIRRHPEYAVRVAAEAADWEARQKPHNEAALVATRRFVPFDVASSTAAAVEASLVAKCPLAKPLAKRVWAKQALWLVWLSPDRIKKLHPADLRGRFAVAGLDLVELRAVYAVLPQDFDNDPKAEKRAWRDDVRAKLVDLVDREPSLAPAERRHPAYLDLPAILDVNDPSPPCPPPPISPQENGHDDDDGAVSVPPSSQEPLPPKEPPPPPPPPPRRPALRRRQTIAVLPPRANPSADLLAAIAKRRQEPVVSS